MTQFRNQIGKLWLHCIMKSKLITRSALLMLIVLDLMPKMVGNILERVLVLSTCGHTMDNTNLVKVVGTCKSAVTHIKPHHTLFLMEGRFNGSVLMSSKLN